MPILGLMLLIIVLGVWCTQLTLLPFSLISNIHLPNWVGLSLGIGLLAWIFGND
jgi:hypothetical protein